MARTALLTAAEALTLLRERLPGTSYRMLVRWLNAGRFPGAEKTAPGPRGDWRIPRKSVEQFEHARPGRKPAPASEPQPARRPRRGRRGSGGERTGARGVRSRGR